MKAFKLVIIEWVNSVLGFQGWKDIEKQDKQLTVFISVGYWVHADKRCKILFPHIEKEFDENRMDAGIYISHLLSFA